MSAITSLAPRYIFYKAAPLSTQRKVVRVVGYIACGSLSLFVSEPSVVASLTQLSGKISKKALVGTSAFVAGLDWASLGTYGGCEFINSILVDQTEVEKELFKPLFGKFGSGCLITASVVFGMGQRLPTIPEALRFNRSHPDFARGVAVTSIFVESWLPSYSTFITINRVFNRRLFVKKLLIAKLTLIEWTSNSRKSAIYLSNDKRRENFPYLLQESPPEINLIVSEMWINGKEIEHEKPLFKRCVDITSYSLSGIVLVSMIGLFLLDALLAKSAVNYFSHNFALVAIGIALTVLPMLYGAPKIGVDGVNETLNMVTDQRQTYGEYVFPVTSKMLKVIALLFSFTQYFEQKALVDTYLDPGVMNGLLTYTNTISCGFMITKSYYTIIEAFLYLVAYYRKYDAEIYAQIKQRTDRIENLLVHSTPQQMMELLEVCDAELKIDAFGKDERALLIQA